MKLSANAKMVRMAITAAYTPLLAQDAKIGDLSAIIGSIKSLKPAAAQKTVVDAVTAHFTNLLAADAALPDVADLLAVIAADEDPEDIGEDEEEDPPAVVPPAKPKGKKAAAAPAMDATEPTVSVAAMDAAIAKTAADTVAKMNAIHQAVRDVEPLIGQLAIAQDSAEAVYKLALDHAKIDVTGVHPSAFRAMVGMLPKAGTAPVQTRVTLAQDSATAGDSFAKRFPGAQKLKGGM